MEGGVWCFLSLCLFLVDVGVECVEYYVCERCQALGASTKGHRPTHATRVVRSNAVAASLMLEDEEEVDLGSLSGEREGVLGRKGSDGGGGMGVDGDPVPRYAMQKRWEGGDGEWRYEEIEGN